MTPERWKLAERLYHEALERAPDERASFVAHACAGDEELRQELESLLEYQRQAGDFIETPRPNETQSAPGRFVGALVGAYRLESFIAVGGMGEVYRGRDTRLDRIVAVKILPGHFADDPARRERFRREARIISSLTHPHICALYDVGVHEGVQYLVMEYVDGETLHDRVRRGSVPVAEALQALIQILDALDKAHRRGIVHRDLKPGNVMWTKSGIKLLDFGLARRSPGPLLNDDLRTTGHSPPLTAEGTIVGTVQYMAPEQLQGLMADARSDIFAFGALAYEMLTGLPAFSGDSPAAVISAILRDEPKPITLLLPRIPSALATALGRCLAKDPDDRWQTARDLLFQLRSITTSPAAVAAATVSERRSRWVERGLWIGVAIALAIASAVWFHRNGAPPATEAAHPPAVIFHVSPAGGTSLTGFRTPFAVSPNGKYLAYIAAGDDGVRQLWVRSLDAERERQLPGTDGADSPFWSPDSQWIGFFAARSLKKVRVSTGVTQTVASDMLTSGGATWGIHDDILFPHPHRGLTRVAAATGRVSRVTTEPGNQFTPQFLGDGRHFIYAATGRSTLAVADVDGGRPRDVMTLPVGTTSVGYGRGYVFYAQDGALFARALDEQRIEVTGEPVQVATGIPAGIPSRSPFSVSASGVLAYWTNPLGAPAVLRWFDRGGRASSAVAPPARYRGFTLAPDDERLIFARIGKTGDEDLWVRRLPGTTETRVTFNGSAFMPLWSPDGTQVAFSGFAIHPPPTAYVKSLATDRPPSSIGNSPVPTFAASWTADGRALVVRRLATDLPSHDDLWIQPLAGGAAARLWFDTPANEMQAKVSPDGRWIAYTTDESGNSEVWIASYPSGPVKQQVSRAGGDFPEWAQDELFFLAPDQQLIAARITTAPSGVAIGPPETLFQVPNLVEIDPSEGASNPFVVTSDGRRFLIAERAHDPDAAPLTVVVNWPALVRR